jgi:hypothetical protein
MAYHDETESHWPRRAGRNIGRSADQKWRHLSHPVPEFKRLPQSDEECIGLKVFPVAEHKELRGTIVCVVVGISTVSTDEPSLTLKKFSGRRTNSVFVVPKRILRIA